VAAPSAAAADQPPAAPVGRYVGTLVIQSEPAGARVFVNAHALGVTPLVLANRPAGSHVVRIEHDGFERWSASVQVVTGDKAVVNAKLVAAPLSGGDRGPR
jgi:hypothetical protein